MKITSRAPTRIDLAGGTVDIWPLYLMLKDAVTINVGIDLFAEATLEEIGDPGVTLKSDDQGHELKLTWNQLCGDYEAIKPHPSLELHVKLLRHFSQFKHPKGGLTLRTRAKSPAGAGLGGSSTLSIAMIGALSKWVNPTVDLMKEGERLIEIARDIETTVIKVPAGLQDYYGAMFGKLQSIHWGAGTHNRSWLSDDTLAEVNKRVLLFYSGQSRNSGINNWALYKGLIDEARVSKGVYAANGVAARFQGIADATVALEKALSSHDWDGAGQAISDEWKIRRTLAEGISTPEMDHAFSIATQEGAQAHKICGAGGGGCFFVYLAKDDPGLKERVRAKVLESVKGIQSLPFNAVKHGLDVTVSNGG